jgi:hypothetical protein
MGALCVLSCVFVSGGGGNVCVWGGGCGGVCVCVCVCGGGWVGGWMG